MAKKYDLSTPQMFARTIRTIWETNPAYVNLIILFPALALGFLNGYHPRVMQNFLDLVERSIGVQGAAAQVIRTGAFLGAYILATFVVETLLRLARNCYNIITAGALTERWNGKIARIELSLFENPEYLDSVEKCGWGPYMLRAIYMQLNIAVFQYIPQFIILSVYLSSLRPIFIITPLLVFIPILLMQFLRTAIYVETQDRTAPLQRRAKYFQDCICTREFYKEVRILNAFPFFRRLFGDVLDLYNREMWRTGKKAGLIDLLGKLAGLAGFGVIMFMLVGAAIRGEITVGAFTAVFMAINSLFSMLESLIVDNFGYLLGNLGLVQTFLRYLDAPERSGERLPVDLDREITMENVRFRYPLAKKDAVKNVNLTIRSGETLAIVGENGSGKSTLVRLLLGLYLPGDGRVLYGAQDIGLLDPSFAFAQTSAVFQDYARYKMTLKENIAVSAPGQWRDVVSDTPLSVLRTDEDEIAAQVRQVLTENEISIGGEDRTDINIMLSREFGGIDLSGGQWQKVAIARGLFRRHRLIALDEPTAAIDPVEETRLYKRFMEISKDVTSIIVTHRLGSVRIADRIIVMSDGEIVQIGTHEELLTQPGHYADMWRAQAQWYA